MSAPPLPSSLRVCLAGVELDSPFVLASGILGLTASSLARVARAGAGAVTTKSFSLQERAGHKGPTVIAFDHGFLNAVGLSNPGWEIATEQIRYQAGGGAPLIASIFGSRVEEYPELAARAAEARPDLIEVNVSCPNVAHELGAPFEAEPAALAEITRRVKAAAGAIPVSIKLSANFGAIGRMAKLCAAEGADVITAINTVGPGMVIDVNVRRPVLGNAVGGVSGPAILPVAVRAVYEIRRNVSLPIIGTGGVGTTEDALQMILAGATAVGVGSAVYEAGPAIFGTLNAGLARYLAEHELDSLGPLTGAAHG